MPEENEFQTWNQHPKVT